MKLYTEEEVNKAMLLYLQGFTRMTIFAQHLTPIELPSETIEQLLIIQQLQSKIQGGNNEP